MSHLINLAGVLHKLEDFGQLSDIFLSTHMGTFKNPETQDLSSRSDSAPYISVTLAANKVSIITWAWPYPGSSLHLLVRLFLWLHELW